MSLSREVMMDLMAYADGELEGDARTRTEQLVKTSDEARRVVDAMRSIGDVVRELPEARSSEREIAAGIADSVMEKIAQEPPRGEVVSLEARRKVARVRFGMALASALAIAAGVAVYLRSNAPAHDYVASDTEHETTPVIQPVPGASDQPPPAPAASVAQNDEKGNDEVDLEEVESQNHTVSVFYVPKSITGAASANAGATSIVVWIDDHGGH